MLTTQAQVNIKAKLYNIVSNLAKQDFIQANKGKRRKSYSLSSNTLEAQGHYKTLCKPLETITTQEETEIKDYINKLRTHSAHLMTI